MRKPQALRTSPISVLGAAVLALAVVVTFTPCCKVFASTFASSASINAEIDSEHSHGPGDRDDRHGPDGPCQTASLDAAIDAQKNFAPGPDAPSLPVATSLREGFPLSFVLSSGNVPVSPRAAGPPLYLRFGRLLN